MTELAISGAGLAGTLLAISLAKRGFTVDLYERRSDLRATRVDFGRSINLALSARGAHALASVGLKGRVLERAVPMRARAIHSPKGQVAYQPFGRTDDETLWAIERHTLNIVLLDAAEETAGVRVHFDQRMVDVDCAALTLTLRDEISGSTRQRPFQALIATEGAFSATRKLLVDRGATAFGLDQMAYGYKELPITAIHARDLRRECLHLWPRRSFLMIANPNPDRSFSATLFMPHEGPQASFAAIRTADDVNALFRAHFPDALERMPTVAEDFFARPTGSLPTVRGGPWNVGGKVLLLGDAAHALVPFFAQGMNSAFEDTTVLVDCIDRAEGDLEQAFAGFYGARKANTDAIAELAMQNYREIQDYIADERFLLRKRIEQELMRRYPALYTSMHVLVMFTRVPYAFAKACGALQAALLDRLCAETPSAESSSADRVDWRAAEPLLATYAEEVRRLATELGVDVERGCPAGEGS